MAATAPLPEIPALVGEAAPSPAGPAGDAPLRPAPAIALPRLAQLLRFNQRQIEFMFRARRELGEVFSMRSILDETTTVTSHPDHVRSLFTAKPEEAPSLTAESPLRPIVGPNSVLTANGPRHLRQRKLLLPSFHGDSIARYTEMIEQATHRELDRWPVGEVIELAPRMQAITLDVIMSGIFGIDGSPAPGTPERGLYDIVVFLTKASTSVLAQFGEVINAGREEARGLLKRGVQAIDDATYPIIDARRRVADLEERTDIMSLLMRATTEEGEHLTDRELRDELITLVLAGFETTANSLSWTWERLLRTPAAYDLLRGAVHSGASADEVIEATITEGMRARPVIPMIGRRVTVPWRLGDVVVPAGSPISMSILLVHHRADLYPDPFGFRPERWLGRKPGTYEWIPFGGGTRRCLGASLAMAEQRVVLRAMAERLELEADRSEPERAMHRNVTMIPARGARAVVRVKR
jgi:cytochrome P450